jgi:hypothetical protein
MILRRFAEALRTRDWLTVGIELVIVVVGVFLGIQVSNWNESRHEQHRARGYLERIQGDLQDDIGELGKRRTFWTQVAGYGNSAIAYAETGRLVDDSAWQTVLAFYQASQLFPYVPVNITYEEMRGAGELSLLRDQALRQTLAVYYVGGAGEAANFLFRVEPEYRKLVRGLTPSVASRQVWTACHRTEVRGQALLDCDSPMAEPAAQAVLDGYLADPRLLAELRFWITNLEVMTSLIAEHERSALALAERVQMELQQ